ncbi:hypothetical protein Ahy_A03g013559 [Arachis hypogaea]|uniref:Protein FAR1-RELATED SEQUENCE n=1 Tax=Arachis hypogaea TaxID=3818 RepID=A0A445DVQ2_ARAHY|nr:hypothetical protein Ahy_A03g013559 [Arachis hypogaea]
MNESTTNQLNECDLDNSFEMHQFYETTYVVDEKFVPKVGMIFKTLEKAGKFYKYYSKLVGFSTKLRNMTPNGDNIKNKLIRGEVEIKDISNFEDKPFSWVKLCGQNLRTHNEGCWSLDNFQSCFESLTSLETHEEAKIRLSKTYQSFVAAVGSHRELGFIEKDIRNYITREVRNISKEDDAKEFGKYLKVQPRRQQVAFREQAKREFDAVNFHTVIPYATKSAIEAQFQHVYTDEKFGEVQAQFRGKVNCITRSMHSTLGFTTYEVIEQVSNSTFNKFVVTYDAVSPDVKCHCLLFESRGILCRHSLSVLSFERVDNVALKYILERWSKNIKRRHTHIKSSQDEPLLEPRSKRFDKLHNICEFTSESEELTEILHRAFNKVMAEMEEYQERRKRKSLLTDEEATLSNVNDLQSPPCVKTRGRPKNRLVSNLEKKISNAMKKKKKTAPSELNLLDSRSSIQSSSTLYDAPDMNYPRDDCTRQQMALGVLLLEIPKSLECVDHIGTSSYQSLPTFQLKELVT